MRHPPRDIAPNVDDLVIESGPGAFHHVHYLHIPRAFLKSPPPGGAKLTTSKAFLHQHHITLTAKELRGVGEGKTVIQRASSHVFVIALAKGVSEPTT